MSSLVYFAYFFRPKRKRGHGCNTLLRRRSTLQCHSNLVRTGETVWSVSRWYMMIYGGAGIDLALGDGQLSMSPGDCGSRLCVGPMRFWDACTGTCMTYIYCILLYCFVIFLYLYFFLYISFLTIFDLFVVWEPRRGSCPICLLAWGRTRLAAGKHGTVTLWSPWTLQHFATDGGSWNGGTPICVVYKGKFHENGWLCTLQQMATQETEAELDEDEPETLWNSTWLRCKQDVCTIARSQYPDQVRSIL